jgi:hypothetical protein
MSGAKLPGRLVQLS